ncbi:MAG TPA: hypothetical protein VF207_08245, partial [Chthoniobacterales bacterium]
FGCGYAALGAMQATHYWASASKSSLQPAGGFGKEFPFVFWIRTLRSSRASLRNRHSILSKRVKALSSASDSTLSFERFGLLARGKFLSGAEFIEIVAIRANAHRKLQLPFQQLRDLPERRIGIIPQPRKL